jgi:ATP-dependent Lon protease
LSRILRIPWLAFLLIGGLKEKMIAAHRGGIDTVLIPKENEKDLKEIPPQIKRAVKIIMVDHMDEVLRTCPRPCCTAQR